MIDVMMMMMHIYLSRLDSPLSNILHLELPAHMAAKLMDFRDHSLHFIAQSQYMDKHIRYEIKRSGSSHLDIHERMSNIVY